MPIVDNELVAEVNYPAKPLSKNAAVGPTLFDLVRKNVAQLGDAPWLTDLSTGKSMTYDQLVDAMARVAASLQRRGLRANDVVLVMASNHVETAVFFFAVWLAGGINACLTLSLMPDEIARRARDVGAKFVLTDELRAGRVLDALASVDCVDEVLVIGQYRGCTPFDDLLQQPADDLRRDFDIQHDDMTWLMYSSGTTGVSKGIVHTQATILRLLGQDHVRFYANRRVVFINYMINAGGMLWAVLFTTGHGQITCMSDFSDEKLLPAIHQVRPHVVSLFPSQVAYICRHPQLDQFDLSSVLSIVTGGSTTNPVYERQLYDKVPNLVQYSIGYGMSEIFIVSNTSSASKPSTSKAETIANLVVGSVGRLVPNTKLKIIEPETGRKLGPNQVGEICAITSYMMKGYLNQPQETAKAIVDGWMHTGDKGYYDADGNVFVIGRFKELIKYRMAHVVPTNIEKYLMTHPAVEDAAVVGRPDDVDGELPTAFVVVRKGQSTTAEEIIQFIQERVVDEERLRGGVRFTGEIPRNDLGKIVRHQLMQMLPV